jgi:hypothetical protein
LNGRKKKMAAAFQITILVRAFHSLLISDTLLISLHKWKDSLRSVSQKQVSTRIRYKLICISVRGILCLGMKFYTRLRSFTLGNELGPQETGMYVCTYIGTISTC